ncbi:cytochrome P450 71A4-like protein [Tanacetum coccineum]
MNSQPFPMAGKGYLYKSLDAPKGYDTEVIYGHVLRMGLHLSKELKRSCGSARLRCGGDSGYNVPATYVTLWAVGICLRNIRGYNMTGTQVMINVWMISRDPMVWEDAEEFKPDKFLNNNIDYKGLDFEFLPFGAGRRGCPGIQFGMAITKLALANLVYRFNFELPNKGIVKELDMSESTGLTIHRKNPLKVVATPCF